MQVPNILREEAEAVLVPCLGVVGYRHTRRKRMEKMRMVYLVYFPPGNRRLQMMRWLRLKY